MPACDPPSGPVRRPGRPRKQPANNENGSVPAQSKSKAMQASKKRKNPPENLRESVRANKRPRGKKDAGFLDPFAASETQNGQGEPIGQTHQAWEPPYSVREHEEMYSNRSLPRSGSPAFGLGPPSPAGSQHAAPALAVLDPAILNAPPAVPIRHPRMPNALPQDHSAASALSSTAAGINSPPSRMWTMPGDHNSREGVSMPTISVSQSSCGGLENTLDTHLAHLPPRSARIHRTAIVAPALLTSQNQDCSTPNDNIPPVPHSAPRPRLNPSHASQHHRPTSPILPPPQPIIARIPPAITDQLAALDCANAQLSRKLDEFQAMLSGTKNKVIGIENLITTIDKRTSLLEDDRENLRCEVDSHQTSIELLMAQIEGLAISEGLPNESGRKKNQKKPEKYRNNSLNVMFDLHHGIAGSLNLLQTAIRKTFLGAMGLTNTRQLASYTPRPNGIFWSTDEASGDQILVPNFEIPWADNSPWVDWMVQFARKNLTNYAITWTPEMVSKQTYSDLAERIQASFLSFQKRSRDLKQSDRQPKLAKNKHNQRKQRKAEERAQVRNQTTLMAKCWDFLFEAAYQSTDESDDDPNIDPDTDDDDPTPLKGTKRVWYACAPTYRSSEVLAAIHILDTLVSQKRSRAATSSGNQPHPFLRDQPRHRPLPKRRGKSIRIPKALVDVDWLAMNPMYDLPAFIADENIDEADEDMQVIQSHVTDSRMNGKELGCESDSSEESPGENDDGIDD